MAIEPEDDPRRRKMPTNPFDDLFKGLGLAGKDFERLFDEMQRSLAGALNNVGNMEPGKPYVHGFSFKIGPDGKPHMSEFGNRSQMPTKGKPVFSDEREPLTDVIDEGKTLSVTLEVPGVEKKDIDLRVTESELEVSVDNEARKYHKRIALPTRVKPPTTKATYKNGVLDVTIEKVITSEPKKGFRVSVD
jgi:HSP20 family protein